MTAPPGGDDHSHQHQDHQYQILTEPNSLHMARQYLGIKIIGVTYQYPPLFGLGVPYPPLFRTQVKNLLSSEAICGDQFTLKPFSAGAPPRTPSPESSCLVSFSKHRWSLREGFQGWAPNADGQPKRGLETITEQIFAWNFSFVGLLLQVVLSDTGWFWTLL